MPTISVIIPVWNSRQTISKMLESLFRQTMRDFEVIAVNDGSTDGSAEILDKFSQKIKVIHQENRGSNSARNRGWAEAKGEYLFFLDSDVALKPHCFERFLKALREHPEAAYAYPSFRYGRKLFRLWPFSGERLRKMPYIHTGALIRAKDFSGFDESIRRLQDWDLFLTMLAQGKTGVWVPEILFTVQPRPDGISQWVPRWFFWIPWRVLGWKPKRVARYEEAVRMIREKHRI